MIDTALYCEQIQNGLNELLFAEDEQLGKGYEFSITPDIKRFKRGYKDTTKNEAKYYINALMTSYPSPNVTTASGIIMLVENYTITFYCPSIKYRMTAEDTPEYIEDGAYIFIEEIKRIVDLYFQRNSFSTITDDKGIVYGCGFTYTISRTGTAINEPIIGECVPFDINISVNIVENGINSRNCLVEMDGQIIAAIASDIERKTIQSGAIISDGLGLSKAVTTSTAFGMNVSVPATTGTVTEQFINYLLNGNTNACHIVRFAFGADISKYYLMTYANIATRVEGATNASLTLPLVEVAFLPELLDFPEYFTIKKVEFDTIPHTTTRISAFANCLVVGKKTPSQVENDIYPLIVGNTSLLVFNELNSFYDDKRGKYIGYIIACPYNRQTVDCIEIITE